MCKRHFFVASCKRKFVQCIIITTGITVHFSCPYFSFYYRKTILLSKYLINCTMSMFLWAFRNAFHLHTWGLKDPFNPFPGSSPPNPPPFQIFQKVQTPPPLLEPVSLGSFAFFLLNNIHWSHFRLEGHFICLHHIFLLTDKIILTHFLPPSPNPHPGAPLTWWPYYTPR